MSNFLHKNDLPNDVSFSGDIAVDTETKGLRIFSRDRLCVVQLSDGNGDAHLVHFPDANYNEAKNLRKVLSDNSAVKIFHYARFDVAALDIFLGVKITNIYCTKIASKLSRTYTDKHSLKYLVKEFANTEISKQQQCTDWSKDELSREQISYAANDVLYLHKIREGLDEMLEKDGRDKIAQRCFDFIPTVVELDAQGWENANIFSHNS